MTKQPAADAAQESSATRVLDVLEFLARRSTPSPAAIIAMSHALGKTVVAEGVETEEQAVLLRALRCDQAQGFLLSRAVPAAEFEELVLAKACVEALV